MTVRGGATAAATAATLLLAGCGGSNSDDRAAGRPDDAKRLAFATCLRKAGVDVQDSVGGGMDVRVPRNISKARMTMIERDCARETGGGPRRGREATPEQKARLLDQGLKFARCMRAHGVDMVDPKPDAHGIQIAINGSGGDPQSPVFQRAQRECGSLNPKGKGAGGKPKGPR